MLQFARGLRLFILATFGSENRRLLLLFPSGLGLVTRTHPKTTVGTGVKGIRVVHFSIVEILGLVARLANAEELHRGWEVVRIFKRQADPTID